MTEIEIRPRQIDLPHAAIAHIDAAIASQGLTTSSKGTVKSYPGCTHWHVRCGREQGTLEITLWPAKKRAWFKIQAGRKAAWIERVLPRLKQAIER